MEEPSQFKQEWEAKKLLKRTKKKAKKSLMEKGHSPRQSSKMVNSALKQIVDNRPERRSAGRGG